MNHKTVATKDGGVDVELSLQEIEDKQIEDEKNANIRLDHLYIQLRNEAYDSELGDASEQLGYACDNGLPALKLLRDEIKARFPKPVA